MTWFIPLGFAVGVLGTLIGAGGGFMLMPILFGVVLQYAPTALHHLRKGANPLAFSRSALESEVFALRPVQLLIPHVTHRLEALQQRAQGLVARKLRKGIGQPGKLVGLFVLGYGIARFIVEFFRGDDRGMVGSVLSTSQVVALAILPVGLFMLWRLKARAR